ncbi:MAG: YhgE/Pip family protein [Clostridium sp.]
MRNIIKVFKRDIKSIIRNPVALLIVIGVCVLPSLYAWVNIKACWDTYENTGTIPVAIVNNDKGTSFMGKDMNVGNDVVSELKKNTSIGWKFVDEKQGNLGVIDGTYYAMIEIPEDFSKELTSLLDEKPKKPKITYKVNTKSNPVAVKISDAAEGALVGEITSNFINTVNKEVFASLNGYGIDIEANKDKIITFKNAIITLDENMNVITGMLDTVNSSATNLNDYLNEVKGTLPSISNQISNLEESSKNAQNLVNQSRENFNNSIDSLKLNLNEAKAAIDRIKPLIDSLGTNSNNIAISGTISQISSNIDYVNRMITSEIKFLEGVNKVKPNDQVSNMIVSLNNIQNALNSEKESLNQLQKSISEGNDTNTNLINDVTNNADKIVSQLNNAVEQFDANVQGQLDIISKELVSAANDAAKLLETANGMVDQVDNLLSSATDGSKLTADISSKLKDDLIQFSDIISQLSDKLQLVKDDNLEDIITILQSNPNFMGDFISAPFNLKEEPIYHVPNYGSSMAPIYSVLALWVGALILTSVLKTEPPLFEGSEKITIRQKHFGKMLTFATLAFIQGLVVAVGNKVLLNVYTVNAPLMVAFSIVTAVTFTIIVYTLVAILGNLGKALSIVLMIIQLAGCGGTYPIQVDPKIFRILQPFFPFTYGVGGFREAIAGPLASSVVIDFTVLILFALLFILIGFFFKVPLHKKVRDFENRFKESGVAE